MPKKTTADIKQSGNDYVIGVKENQPTLHRKIVKISKENTPLDLDYSLEKNRGRIEQRTVSVYQPIGIDTKEWVGLQQVVQIQRMIQYACGKTSQETHYYIDSTNSSAALLNKGIRAHWGIENSLHYTKDVTFKEDASLIHMGNAPQVISLVKNWAIAIFRFETSVSVPSFVVSAAKDGTAPPYRRTSFPASSNAVRSLRMVTSEVFSRCDSSST